jgi:DNA-directed RNA polymerase subunit RPC12/RpoP
MTSASPELAVHCPRCGSANVRRSSPHSALERLGHAALDFHFFRCRSCSHRGWRLGRLPDPPHPDQRIAHLGRPVERRDLKRRKSLRRRTFLAFLLAAGLGMTASLYLHGCQQHWTDVTDSD